jgi:hypothetical protein
MATRKRAAPGGVKVGKFDILATFAYAEALRDGADDADARQRGLVAAIMGARARSGTRRDGRPVGDASARKAAAERKRRTTLTAESFDEQVAARMGDFFHAEFFPMMDRLVAAGLGYDDVKRVAGIPPTWGAKIAGAQFVERAEAALRGGREA